MTYQKRSECPLELQKLIDLVNVLPMNGDLPNPFDILEGIELDTAAENLNEAEYQRILKAKNIWFEQIKKMLELEDFKTLREFLTTLRPDLDPSNKFHTTHDVFNAYARFNSVRKIFNQVLECAKVHKLAYEQLGEGVYSWQEFNIKEIGFVTLFAFGEEGKINFGIPKILEPLQGCELIRVRRCVICERIFYAKKTNAETCQKSCAKKLFNRKRLAETKMLREKQNNHFQPRNKNNGTL